jgi:hypothetical protein
MNVNAKIDWHAGMELTAQTFIELDKCLERNRQITNTVACGNHFGILPTAAFSCKGVFVKKTLEITPLSFMALMPSGDLLHVDENVVVDIPILYGKEYYLGCKQGSKTRSFDKEQVPFISPVAECGIYTFDELTSTSEVFPLMKFKVNEGVFSVDKDYIPPFLTLGLDTRFQDYINAFASKIAVLANHKNLESGEAKRSFLRYANVLKNYSTTHRVQHFIELLQEIAAAVDFYIVQVITEKAIEHNIYSPYDIVSYLTWIDGYLHGAATILDGVVLEDKSIDFDALKLQVKEEIYEKVYPELKEALYKELHEELKKEIWDELYSSLSDYINGNFRKEIFELLEGRLSEELYEKLYKTLYDGLYNALFVPAPVEEEEEFLPLI